MGRAAVVALLLLGSTSPAYAGDKVLLQPVPDWIKPAPPIDAVKLDDTSPVLIVFDNQQKLHLGQVWTYMETATRVANQEVLNSIGTVQLPWQPAQGDLIIHTAEIVRGGQRIDLLKGSVAKLTVLRREQQLDQRALDGMLTATMPVEGLTQGDVLHLIWSVTRRDPTLRGDLQTYAPLLSLPLKMQFGRVRMIWPNDASVHWRAYSEGVTSSPVASGAFSELVIPLPLAKQPEIPTDAPQRFQKLPLLEATTFSDWEAVSKVMAPLYKTDGVIAPGSSLATEVARIERTGADPFMRTALALQLVQEKVRYLLLGMDTGNYVPQAPAQTWQARYGDCKAKTLLLLALLHAMKIEAEPVLASIGLADRVETRLPGVGAFNHVLVRAVINGETLWLDGTDTGSRLADIRNVPPFRIVLPVRPEGAKLMPLLSAGEARPSVAVTIEHDESAALNVGAPFKATVVLRGRAADATRLAAAQASKEDLSQFVGKIVGEYVPNPKIVSRTFTFDDGSATATIVATGIGYPGWDSENRLLKAPLDQVVNSIDFSPDRGRTAWKAIPVKTEDPSFTHIVTRIKLPNEGSGFTVEGKTAFSATLAGKRIDRAISRAGAWVTVDDRVAASGVEIAAIDIPAERQKIAAAKAQLPRIVAPAAFASDWRQIDAAKRAKLFQPMLSMYAKRIADAPEQRETYTDRAWFLERIYDRRPAIADLDKALALDDDAHTHLRRASLYRDLGEYDRAVADAEAAYKLDPGSSNAIAQLANLKSEAGDKDGALALLQQRIDEGGKDAVDFLSSKADVLSYAGDSAGALAAIDQAIAAKPGSPAFLNTRCWIKGTRNTALDTALKDCTKAIELGDSSASAIDSRAMVYFRLNRFDDALADLNSVLDDNPSLAASLFMRGVIQHRLGKAEAGQADLAGARMIAPQIDRVYSRFGIKP